MQEILSVEAVNLRNKYGGKNAFFLYMFSFSEVKAVLKSILEGKKYLAYILKICHQ